MVSSQRGWGVVGGIVSRLQFQIEDVERGERGRLTGRACELINDRPGLHVSARRWLRVRAVRALSEN